MSEEALSVRLCFFLFSNHFPLSEGAGPVEEGEPGTAARAQTRGELDSSGDFLFFVFQHISLSEYSKNICTKANL